MTMTDGERQIVAQLKRIADALGVDPDDEQSFADTTKRFAEGGYTGSKIGGFFVNPGPPEYTIPSSKWWGFGTQEGPVPMMDADRVPTETNPRVWDHIVHPEGEGDHLLNPEADKTGEDTE